MQPKFQLYELVQVQPVSQHALPVAGQQGAVLGMAQDEVGYWSYAVDLGSTTWCFDEEELAPTGLVTKLEKVTTGALNREYESYARPVLPMLIMS